MIRASSVREPSLVVENLHDWMELMIRRVYGFRNFENFRLRVKHFFQEKVGQLIVSRQSRRLFFFCEETFGNFFEANKMG